MNQESLTGLHDWQVTERIFPPSPDILFLNQLLAVWIYHSVHVIPQEGILVAAQLVKKVVYVDMKALEEEAAVSCWRPVGARTDRKLGLIRECAWRLVALATLNLLDLNVQRTRERTRARRSTFSFAHNARACHSHHTPPHYA